ncbi:flavin reductase [Microbacterium sp. NPDC091313]
MSTTHPIDPLAFREVMGNYPTGVTVVTAIVDDAPVGMVVGTFTSVSLDPPLVAFLPTAGSSTFAQLRRAEAFCINVLANDQVDLCRVMASGGAAKFDGVSWSPAPNGAPQLEGAVAYVHCRPERLDDAGDHFIQLCAVDSLQANRQVTPLLFFQGGYGGFSPHGMTAMGDKDLIAGIHLAAIARPQIEQLAREQQCEAAVLVAVNEQELTTAATAYGGSARMTERLGERLPMKPPLGEAYVAWAPPAAIERWLAKSSRDPEVVESFRRRLITLREQGFAASQIGAEDTHDREQLVALMAQYTSGDLTPTRERALLAQMAQLMHFFDTTDFDPGRSYNMGGIMVPVLNPAGEIVMLLRLSQLPQGVTGARVTTWIDRLRAAAAAVESELRSADGDPWDATDVWTRPLFA